MSTYSITRERIPWSPASGDRPLPLGRHVRHDSRNRWYEHRPAAGVTISTFLWPRHIEILDQGDVGSCTGNAMDGALGTSPLWDDLPANHPALDEAEALKIYSAAETIDGDGPYPPNDNGSSGQSVAQAAKKMGLLSGYTWCFSLTAMQAALQTGPVIIGVNWYDSFDSPAADGTISLPAGAQVRGGHEVLVRGVNMTHGYFDADNSWGTSWGIGGSFRIPFAVMTRLLAEQGDCTVPVPLTAPAPVPVPPVPVDADHALWAVAGPWSAQIRTRHDLVDLKAALLAWAQAKGLGS